MSGSLKRSKKKQKQAQKNIFAFMKDRYVIIGAKIPPKNPV